MTSSSTIQLPACIDNIFLCSSLIVSWFIFVYLGLEERPSVIMKMDLSRSEVYIADVVAWFSDILTDWV